MKWWCLASAAAIVVVVAWQNKIKERQAMERNTLGQQEGQASGRKDGRGQKPRDVIPGIRLPVVVIL